MAQNTGQSFVPLHYGRSFICYRDVNKAIDQHRELFGLKLSLKKSTKIEAYPLTSEQAKSVNLRLKYCELEYTCCIDNGRVGRPGNDEKCGYLVSIRLSPDARTLVVCETHIHEYSDKNGYGKIIDTPMPTNSILQQHMSDSTQLGSLASLPSPSVFAASIIAAAAAAAGPSAINTQVQLRSPVVLQQHHQAMAGISTNTSITILPARFATSLTSTPNNIAGSIALATLTNGSNVALVNRPSNATPLPGQLLIPSFYSSKSMAGHITFSSAGASRNSTPLLSTSAKTFTNNSQSLNRSKSYISSGSPGSGSNSQEKLTMKLKKSQFSPNEMVVVGSARDALEQQDLRQVLDRSTPRTHVKKGVPAVGGRINAVVANLLEKVVNNSNNSLSVTHVLAPFASAKPGADDSDDISIAYASPGLGLNQMRAMQGNGSAIAYVQIKSHLAGNKNYGKGHLAANRSVYPQPIQAKPRNVGFSATDSSNLKRLQEKIRVKKAEKAAMKGKIKVKPLLFLHSSKATRPVGRPTGTTKDTTTKAGRMQPNAGPRLSGCQPTVRFSNNNSSNDGGVAAAAAASVGRKIRKCRQRSVASSGGVASAGAHHVNQPLLDTPDKMLPIDTELGEGTKQRLVQSVLLKLMRTVTQLQMVQFSDAMETIGTLNDALRLKHRVQLSIQPSDDTDGVFALLGPGGDDDLSVAFEDRGGSASEGNEGVNVPLPVAQSLKVNQVLNEEAEISFITSDEKSSGGGGDNGGEATTDHSNAESEQNLKANSSGSSGNLGDISTVDSASVKSSSSGGGGEGASNDSINHDVNSGSSSSSGEVANSVKQDDGKNKSLRKRRSGNEQTEDAQLEKRTRNTP